MKHEKAIAMLDSQASWLDTLIHENEATLAHRRQALVKATDDIADWKNQKAEILAARDALVAYQ